MPHADVRRRGSLIAALLLLAAALLPTAAGAVPISRTFDFTASAFDDIISSFTAPTSPVTGSVTVIFDPDVAVSDETDGITLNSLNIALGSAISFSYFVGLDQIIIGGLEFGAGVQGTGFDDFGVVFTSASAATPGFKSLLYRVTGPLQLGAFLAGTGSVSATPAVVVPPPPPPTDVPEPGALAALGAGLVGLVLTRRRRA